MSEYGPADLEICRARERQLIREAERACLEIRRLRAIEDLERLREWGDRQAKKRAAGRKTPNVR
jgi:hypothetical protein